MSDAPTKGAIVMAWVAGVLVVGLAIGGIALYGFSAEVRDRFLSDLMARPGGPMTFRFILQPAMAVIAALRDGVKDAKAGRLPYFWAVIHSPEDRGARLRESLIATARILLLGLVMDTIYQLTVLRAFYPTEAALVAVLLALLPYVVLRGPITRIARHWVARPASNGSS